MLQQKILDLFKLDGRVALIIGGNRGLGLSMAKALAETGADISIAARDKKENEKAAKEIESSYNTKCLPVY
ncbi:MAG: SDR family NAD(P)-dependent oxidoreductase, partial [Chitinophagaceae bacterium]